MKIAKHILLGILAVFLVTACEQGIDSISRVEPGPDESAPVVTIKYPAEGTQIQVPELVASINIQFEVTDDIEIGSIKVTMDGTEIASYSQFKDYRRAVEEFLYENVTNGSHTLSITATDLESKSTTVSVNFEKRPPYTPIYEDELFYMPFDGDYMEMISFQNATVVGNPGFTGDNVQGTNAYAGATDSYLTFPMENLKSDEFSAVFWYKVNAVPDRAGILSVGASADSRQQGFRLFREGDATSQRLKLNVGIGSGESWNDGGLIDATVGEWVHIAITISQTKNTIYFNGAEILSSDMAGAIDWTGCENITIMSGGETFSYWDHLSDLSYMDELRFFSKALTPVEIQTIIYNESPYVPKYDGEVFYMPFEGNNKDLVSETEATVVGTTDFAEGKLGQAYAGATDSYLTFPTENIKGDEFSAVFWYYVNADPDRAGILSTGAEPENRQQGFRLFREGDATSQRIKLNVGTGSGESWNDGGLIDATAGEWVHIAITISQSKNTIYFNGVEILSSDMAESIDWTGCEDIDIMSGGETFSYWNHLSDLSYMDELRFFNKALSQAEIQAIIDAEQ